jgi:hypothetical protein
LAKEEAITKTINMALQGKAAPSDGVATITRDSGEKILSIDVKPGEGLPGQLLLNAAKSVLQKSEAPPKTSTNIVP